MQLLFLMTAVDGLIDQPKKYHQKIYSPPTTFITNTNAITSEPISFMATELRVPKSELVESSSYEDKIKHIYYSHVVDGRTVENHSANIQLAKSKNVIAYSYNFQGKQNVTSCLKFQNGLVSELESQLGMRLVGDTKESYVDTGKGLVPTLSFKLEKGNDQVHVAVDQCTGETVQLLNLVQSFD
ncbi:hypothetical protein HDV04_006228 [Boothiomyces sp. JEL0838]|nr:hypothetical protein HDV04_006228 [Boothiomyces sp. JEL0838]